MGAPLHWDGQAFSTLSVSFTYSGGAGLETVVNVEPQLLGVEVPATSK